MLVWLIRHAESVANAGAATDDPSGIPVTERGEAQADHLANAIPRPPALIVTSPYVRTKLTARPTLARFPDVTHQEWPVEEFTYLQSLHGQSTTVAQRRPMVEEYWQRADPSHVDGPGAESFAGLLRRADAFLHRLRQCASGPVAVFTHGMFIRAVLWALMTGTASPTAGEMRLFRSFVVTYELPNTAIVHLRLDAGGKGTFRCGEVAHLPTDLITGA
ncbi:broad specificity phosphatase PhoE [Herbihabitans rhizosphaerae]|uniref:Broad specificity phosphatase PhoE n=1 Tax=Herbihabitans rhizosphaerae TaxID=1872711 RepID=A0A4Q7KH92_9PSEU|nr:histidine phosphatase family protein [Herbihabitans rhizosphaerae]RZS34251.1 broad specificity phosphatase PhoE [Herbihabitans rhizosphaerae]